MQYKIPDCTKVLELVTKKFHAAALEKTTPKQPVHHSLACLRFDIMMAVIF